jgi:hypothetical protein
MTYQQVLSELELGRQAQSVRNGLSRLKTFGNS